MKQKNYHIYLTNQERSQVIQTLIELKNSLIARGRYTDAAPDALCKLVKAKKKKINIQYV